MVTSKDLLAYLTELLTPELFSDYAPNGLQVAGKAEISTLVTGVTACSALLEQAIAIGADAILVHHGYFWQNENSCITGIKKQRLSRLLGADINLFAYHLPLDMHPELGNNVQLAQKLDLEVVDVLRMHAKASAYGNVGKLNSPCEGGFFAEKISTALGRDPLHIPGKAAPVTTIAWCTGAGQLGLDMAVALGLDAYLTGEISEQSVHLARESGVHLFAAGHHATERYGVQAVGEVIAKTFHINHTFIDIDNPV